MAVNINADTTTGLELTSDTSGNINIQNDGTTVVAVTSSGAAVTGTLSASNGASITGNLSIDGNLSVTGTVPGAFFSQSVTFTTNTTATTADTGKVFYTATTGLSFTLPTPPGGTDTIAFGLMNESADDLIILAQTGDYIGTYLESAALPSGQRGIIASVGDNWKLINLSVTNSINVRQVSTGTYTPGGTVSAFLVCLGGATGGSGGNWNASGGGAYGEKFYASPSGTYNVTLGAGGAGGSLTSGGSSNFNAQLTVNGSSSGSGSVSGADFSATGGSGGGNNGGGGGGAGRAGNGGNGSASPYSYGGGTGGNNASNNTNGAAATNQAAGVYNLTSLIGSFVFLGGDGNGADGSQYITKVGGGTATIAGGGYGVKSNNNSSGRAAQCTIIEFRG